MIPFAKGHGLGNDYVVVDQADLHEPWSTRAIQKICDRNWGVGSDGILLLVPSTRADFGLRIFNPDGARRRRDRKEHTSELQSRSDLVCRLLLEKKNTSKSEDLLSTV